jgi:glutamine amidotransferase
MSADVVVLDYGSGNVRSAVRALERVGATVTLTSDPHRALECDGLFVPGVGNFHACMAGLAAAHGPRIIGRRISGGRAVLGVCVGMQVLFDGSTEPSSGMPEDGLGEWPGLVERLPADVVPHMGWSTVKPGTDSRLFAGVEDERFYFVHSYAARPSGPGGGAGAGETTAQHGEPFLAAVERGPLSATQFHPEKSGDAGAQLLRNWLATL